MHTDYKSVYHSLSAKLKLKSTLIGPRLHDPKKLKYIPKFSSPNLGLTMDKLVWDAENFEQSIKNAVAEYQVF